MKKSLNIFVKWSLLGGVSLLVFYFLLTALLGRSVSHSFDQFVLLQPWISLLVISFGVQVGIYKLSSSSGVVGTTSTMSGSSMILCCAHHVSELLPFLGISGLSTVLAAYQTDFLILGIVVNLFAIFYLTQSLYIAKVPILKYVFGGLALMGAVLLITFTSKDIFSKILSPVKAEEVSFTTQAKQVGVVEIEVKPKQLEHGKQVIFTVKLNNHTIDLDYDFTKIMTLVDSNGTTYLPESWTGGQGGHHVSGEIIFGSLSDRARNVGLNIKGIDDNNTHFEWKI